MAEILKKPPSQIKIRTLETDVEDMRKSGGGLIAGKVLGRDFEEVSQKINQQEAVTFFPTETEPENVSNKKKIPLIIVATIVIIAIIIGGVLLFTSKSKKQIVSQPTATPQQYISLLVNFNGSQEYQTIDISDINSITQVLAKQTILGPQITKEIVFVKKNGELVKGEEFLKLLYNNFENISPTDQLPLMANFSFIIYSDNQSKKSLAYVLKINSAGYNVFSLQQLKSKFGLAFENLIENSPEILTPQYLENVGKPTGIFQPKEIGPIQARYLSFTTGNEFYYGYYNDYLIIATSEKAFETILNALLPR